MSNQLEQNNYEKTDAAINISPITQITDSSKSHTKINIISGILIVSVILGAKYFLFSGAENKEIKNDPLIGKKITLGLPLIYIKDMNFGNSDDIYSQINNLLECPSKSRGYTGSYLFADNVPNLTYVPTNTEFTVEAVYGNGVKYPNEDESMKRVLEESSKTVVLRDANGVKSTVSAYSITEPNQFCLNGNVAEIPLEIQGAFKKIEQNGSVRVQIVVLDEQAKSNLISKLPPRYKFSNITEQGGVVEQKGLYPGIGIQMDVDGSSFAYLLTQATDLNILSITPI